MLPLRLVVDTNVVVSGALNPHGLERAAVVFAVTPPARLFVSPPIHGEYRRVLSRPELKLLPSDVSGLLKLIESCSKALTPSRTLTACPGPHDSRFLECAEKARADYLITGNKRHFPRFWKNTKVINSREFMEVVAPHLRP